MGFIDWLTAIDPSTRVGAGMGMVALALIGGVLWLSRVRDWPARPAAYRERHAHRLLRRGQVRATTLTGRLRAERAAWEAGRTFAVLFEQTDPVGRPIHLAPREPLAIAAEPAWMADAFTWPQPRVEDAP
jgi:hypothetical protein